MSRLISYDEAANARTLLRIGNEAADDIVNRMSSLRIKEGSRKGLVFEVTLSGLNPPAANFEGSLLEDRRVYTGAEWHMRWGYLHDLSGIVKLHVTHHQPMFNENGSLGLQVFLAGKDWRMGRESSARNWGRVNSSDIARQMAADYGYTNLVIEESQDARARAYIQPASVSDMAYLQQLSRRINFVCYADSDTFYYRPADWESSPHIELSWYAGDPASRLLSFKPDVKEPSRRRTRTNGDNRNGAQQDDKAETSDDRNHGGSVIVVDGHARVNYRESRPEATEDASAEEDESQRTRMSRARQRNALENANTATAKTIGTPQLRRDTNVLIGGVGTILSGVWHITDVTHDLTDDGRYSCELKLKRGAHRRSGNPSLHKVKVPNGGDFDKPVPPGGRPRVVIVDGQRTEVYRASADPNSTTPLSRQLGIRR